MKKSKRARIHIRVDHSGDIDGATVRFGPSVQVDCPVPYLSDLLVFARQRGARISGSLMTTPVMFIPTLNLAHEILAKAQEFNITDSDELSKEIISCPSVVDTDRPPQRAQLLLYFLLSHNERANLVGDLEEEYQTEVLPKFGKRTADLWFWKEVAVSVGPCAWRAMKQLLWLAVTFGWVRG